MAFSYEERTMKIGLAALGVLVVTTACIADETKVEPLSHKAAAKQNAEKYSGKRASIETIGQTAQWKAADARWTGAVYCPLVPRKNARLDSTSFPMS